jgi:predicted dehydrogenase
MSEIGWGILGPGAIADRFASDLAQLTSARRVAVGSRSLKRAESFAAEHRFERAYGSYEAMAMDDEVDVVYVATPHPFHCVHSKLCLRAGKAVLCEKPMAVNQRQALDMVSCARQRGLFLMEAMWTRALPVMRQVRQWLREGRIGEARIVTADFGFRARWDPAGRLLSPALAGGALLDVGVYTIALASMVFGAVPTDVHALAHLGQTGVDEQTGMVLRYEGGGLALLACAIRTQTPQEARIVGTEGWIELPAFWRATSATLHTRVDDPVEITGPSGYRYEAIEVMDCLREGHRESTLIPLDESVATAGLMDRAREEIGLVYPFEQ